jgi:hypothetical protein
MILNEEKLVCSERKDVIIFKRICIMQMKELMLNKEKLDCAQKK